MGLLVALYPLAFWHVGDFLRGAISGARAVDRLCASVCVCAQCNPLSACPARPSGNHCLALASSTDSRTVRSEPGRVSKSRTLVRLSWRNRLSSNDLQHKKVTCQEPWVGRGV
jgi:hypothetical protein